jgi:UDP-N-acetylmuramate dehydrogenase
LNTILQNTSLKRYNTFGIDVSAAYFSNFKTAEEAKELLAYNKRPTTNDQRPTLVLGGGSNILFTKNFNGLVLKNEISGIEKVNEDAEHIYVKAGAGINWHSLVLYCIENNFAGIENLSLIPGNVGASPMQNAFGYRESIFKRKYKGQFIITSVTYKLNKQPNFNTSYGAIEQELEKMGVRELSIRSISNAVINIRSSKLPDPAEIGNAGSFFKNPEISATQFDKLKTEFSNIVGYALENGNVKLAAGWLIEQCGWKGYRNGDAGCHAKQALVLVNYGNAKGEEIFSLSGEIIQSVKEKFYVELEREVNII